MTDEEKKKQQEPQQDLTFSTTVIGIGDFLILVLLFFLQEIYYICFILFGNNLNSKANSFIFFLLD